MAMQNNTRRPFFTADRIDDGSRRRPLGYGFALYHVAGEGVRTVKRTLAGGERSVDPLALPPATGHYEHDLLLVSDREELCRESSLLAFGESMVEAERAGWAPRY